MVTKATHDVNVDGPKHTARFYGHSKRGSYPCLSWRKTTKTILMKTTFLTLATMAVSLLCPGFDRTVNCL